MASSSSLNSSSLWISSIGIEAVVLGFFLFLAIAGVTDAALLFVAAALGKLQPLRP
jgi:hypothetical protein